MNLLEHALVALLIQSAIGLSTGRWWAGAALASGYFLGRELAQAEYRWIEAYGQGLRAHLPWWGALDPRVWQSPDAVADVLGPVIANVLLAWRASRHRQM